jgi:multicomponent K+:H+ antiporter subunit A
MLRMLMQPLLPLVLTVAVYIFLRGHNLPGGGFVAGLIIAIALLLQYLASGIEYASTRLRTDFVRLLGAGLGLCALTGAAAFAVGRPFLTSTHGYVHPPLIEPFELASAMLFDLGILMVVVAALVLALTELGTLSTREQREG